ncbi:hypothetical protein EG328_009964 [Venturia inaequalis]|uniref:Uncharacterized protein n=1 Tax=Venturia inaequalis TaxID=5025 RepID=A0A8H3Z3Q1_VENIN|nr:hypothetical protein EG328_009964 [Venturia inaequalis]KAE9979542.1 hypothetical protein EG327_007009 [Venturia inaequalis]
MWSPTRRSQNGSLFPYSLLYREEGNPASVESQLLDPFPEFQPTSPEVPGHRLYDELPAELRIMIVDQMVAETTDAVITIRAYGLMKLLVKKSSAISTQLLHHSQEVFVTKALVQATILPCWYQHLSASHRKAYLEAANRLNCQFFGKDSTIFNLGVDETALAAEFTEKKANLPKKGVSIALLTSQASTARRQMKGLEKPGVNLKEKINKAEEQLSDSTAQSTDLRAEVET